MMIPEKAGGRAHATTSIFMLSGSMCHNKPAINASAGITISFSIEPSRACQLMTILTDERVIPAENTAIDALALAIKSNEGLAQSGHLRPRSTRITASIGAHATGCSRA